MRLLVAFEKGANPNTAAIRALVPDLEAMGHRVIRFDPHAYAALYGLEGAQRLLIEHVKAYRPHVVITNPPYDMITAETAQVLRDLQVPFLGWRYDDAIHLEPAMRRAYERRHFLREQPRKFTLNATTSRRALAAMREAGTENVAYIRFAASLDPEIDQGTMAPTAVSFLGQPYWENARHTRRIEVIRQLTQQGIPVTLWGGHWQTIPDLAPFHQGVCPRHQMGALFRQSAINLSINGWVCSMPKMRTFEVALAGGFQLADACEELGDYFVIGEELVTTSSYDDLRQKLDYYLAHPEERQRIAAAGQARAKQEHTWHTRWPEMLAALEDRWGRAVQDDDEPDFVDPQHTEALLIAHLGAGHVAEAAGAPWEAAFFYDQALKLNPHDHGALAGQARLARLRHDIAESTRLFTAAKDRYSPLGFVFREDVAHLKLAGLGVLAPKDPYAAAVTELAQLALQHRDWPAFEAVLAASARVDPKSVAQVGFALLDQGEVAKAQQVAETLLAENHQDPNALRCLVECHAKLRDFKTARQYLRAFQEAMPGHPDGQRLALGLRGMEKDQG